MLIRFLIGMAGDLSTRSCECRRSAAQDSRASRSRADQRAKHAAGVLSRRALAETLDTLFAHTRAHCVILSAVASTEGNPACCYPRQSAEAEAEAEASPARSLKRQAYYTFFFFFYLWSSPYSCYCVLVVIVVNSHQYIGASDDHLSDKVINEFWVSLSLGFVCHGGAIAVTASRGSRGSRKFPLQ